MKLSPTYICIYPFRRIPADRPAVQFINRKGYNSLNVLLTAGIDHIIYDVVVTAPGSFHDAGIFEQSEVKGFLGKINMLVIIAHY